MVDEISAQKEFVKISKRVSLKTIFDILIMVQQFTLINSIILLYISVNGFASFEFFGKVEKVNGSNSNEFFVIFLDMNGLTRTFLIISSTSSILSISSYVLKL